MPEIDDGKFSTSYEDKPVKTSETDSRQNEQEKRLKGSEFGDVSQKRKHQPKEYSSQEDLEDAARSEGWVGLDEWVDQGKKAKDWRGADVFLEKGSMFRRIKRDADKIESLEKQLDVVIELNKTVRQAEHSRTLDELRRKKVVALEDNNFKEASEIDTQINAAETKKSSEDQVYKNLEAAKKKTTRVLETQAELAAIAKNFKDNNEWYFTDAAMRAYGDIVANGYKKMHEDKTTSEVIEYMIEEVRERFPNRFSDPSDEGDLEEELMVSKEKPSRKKTASRGVSSTRVVSSKSANRRNQKSITELPEMYQDVYKKLVRAGAFDGIENPEQHYISQLEIDEEGYAYNDK